jgi:SulP family sulfate permease
LIGRVTEKVIHPKVFGFRQPFWTGGNSVKTAAYQHQPGAGNLMGALFGGMGGCAMIGQSMINLNAGGRRWLSGIAAGSFLLSFILVGSTLIERIQLAALVGVMFVVAAKTFNWKSLRGTAKVPRHDTLVMVVVTLVTVLTNLAVAVVAVNGRRHYGTGCTPERHDDRGGPSSDTASSRD